jgi:hypothetical protein
MPLSLSSFPPSFLIVLPCSSSHPSSHHHDCLLLLLLLLSKVINEKRTVFGGVDPELRFNVVMKDRT